MFNLQSIIDTAVCRLVVAFSRIIRLLPDNISIVILKIILKVILFFSPRHRRFAHLNLIQAFPELDHSGRGKIITQMTEFVARLLFDFSRLTSLGSNWVLQNVVCDNPELLNKLLEFSSQSKTGIVFASGHLGSFEILAHYLCTVGFPLNFIVRNFKNQKLDQWWNSQREFNGNRTIPRKGAYKKAFKLLSSGKNLGILFDQNVTLQHAAFVDFFGLKAATTKIVALLAIRNKAKVVVTSIKTEGHRYRVYLSECDFSALYDDESIPFDDKVQILTQKITSEYQSMIENNPGEWFWMHRRWRTRPEGENDRFTY